MLRFRRRGFRRLHLAGCSCATAHPTRRLATNARSLTKAHVRGAHPNGAMYHGMRSCCKPKKLEVESERERPHCKRHLSMAHASVFFFARVFSIISHDVDRVRVFLCSSGVTLPSGFLFCDATLASHISCRKHFRHAHHKKKKLFGHHKLPHFVSPSDLSHVEKIFQPSVTSNISPTKNASLEYFSPVFCGF
jgi:hypothetical protein